MLQKNPIRCPLCRQRLLDASSPAARSTVARPRSLGARADFEIKCPKCGHIISLFCKLTE